MHTLPKAPGPFSFVLPQLQAALSLEACGTRTTLPWDIVVSVAGFYAVYYKPTNEPQLKLRRRTQTDDHALLAQAWQAANDKARELRWIV